MAGIDKGVLKAELVAALTRERDVLARAQRATREGVVHEDSRAESDKDMRATEASYLARGQAQRVEALEDDLDRVRAMATRTFDAGDPIALSALVEIQFEGRAILTFIAPAGGGLSIPVAGRAIQVVTPASPLGRALVGARTGDVVEMERGSATVEYEIRRVG